MARYSSGGDTRRGLGAMGLAIGAFLLLGGGCAAADSESPRCGGESMKPGDACVGGGAYDGYEEKREQAGQASYWLLRVGGGLVLAGGTALAVGPVADAAGSLRSAARRRSRARPAPPSPASPSPLGPAPAATRRPVRPSPAARPAPRPAARTTVRTTANPNPATRPARGPVRPAPPRTPTLQEQLAGELAGVRFPASRLQPGYDQAEVDAFLARIRAGLLGTGPAVSPARIGGAVFGTAGHRQAGYDRHAVTAFLTALAGSLRTG
ncbi:DivIVA domain-containing protein [Streptomyces cremeus]|uniref:DivIVA domain-containing protein n=1 Tax=Streptomyces cremeus TaxID=66881 RepID=A0ABV5P7Z0_STRCM